MSAEIALTTHTRRSAVIVAVVAVMTVVGISCVDRLPVEDRRITSAPLVAKLSADVLWRDYQQDSKAANQRYFGGAIEISGKVTAIEPESPAGPVVMFGQTETLGVRAILLGDQAADIVKAARVNERITLKCFCEGKTLEGHVSLRSCIRP